MPPSVAVFVSDAHFRVFRCSMGFECKTLKMMVGCLVNPITFPV